MYVDDEWLIGFGDVNCVNANALCYYALYLSHMFLLRPANNFKISFQFRFFEMEYRKGALILTFLLYNKMLTNIEVIDFELYFLWTLDIELFDNISFYNIFYRNTRLYCISSNADLTILLLQTVSISVVHGYIRNAL